jgi:hypothetical protein
MLLLSLPPLWSWPWSYPLLLGLHALLGHDEGANAATRRDDF